MQTKFTGGFTFLGKFIIKHEKSNSELRCEEQKAAKLKNSAYLDSLKVVPIKRKVLPVTSSNINLIAPSNTEEIRQDAMSEPVWAETEEHITPCYL